MPLRTFKISPFNEHYEGEYSESMLKWRHLGAIDKSNNIQTLLGSRQVSSILEVGCGTGDILAELKKSGVGTEYQGIDLADPNAHKSAIAEDILLAEYDGSTLPYDDHSFDFVYASHVVEHVTEPRRFIVEAARVAKSYLYFEVPCELHIRTTHAAIQTTIDIGHINSYTPESFILLLQSTGLDIADFRLFDHSYEVHSFHTSAMKAKIKMVLRRGLLKLSPQLASRVFTYHFGVLAKPSTS